MNRISLLRIQTLETRHSHRTSSAYLAKKQAKGTAHPQVLLNIGFRKRNRRARSQLGVCQPTGHIALTLPRQKETN